MDAWTKALQPVSAPDFIDNAFKESPEGVSFRQWQPVEGVLDSMGRQLHSEEVYNNGGSSQGSHTAMDSPHRRMFSGGTATDMHCKPYKTFCRKQFLVCVCLNEAKLISVSTSAGQGDTNNGSNYTGSTNDMQDVNSPLQDPARTSGKAGRVSDGISHFGSSCNSISSSGEKAARAQVPLQVEGIVSAQTPSGH